MYHSSAWFSPDYDEMADSTQRYINKQKYLEDQCEDDEPEEDES